jgi:hypothetical protein
VDTLIVEHLKQHRRGATIKSLLHEIGPKLGNWPRDAEAFLQFAMYGHLERLKQNGIVRPGNSVPIEYSLV